jgi:hypothetical protein
MKRAIVLALASVFAVSLSLYYGCISNEPGSPVGVGVPARDGAPAGTWTVSDSITISGREVCGLAYDSGYLWVTHMPPNGDSEHVIISKLDPVSHQVVSQSREFAWNGRGICVGNNSLWLADALHDVIHELDPTTFQERSAFSTPGSEPCGVTFDGVALWLTDPWYRSVYKLDTLGHVISSFAIPYEYRWALEWDGGGMWTTSGATTLVFYTPSGQMTATEELMGLPRGVAVLDVAFGADKLFASSGSSMEYAKREKIYILEKRPSRPQAVRICHVPPGNPENAHVIVISEKAVHAHLAHGDCFAPEDAIPGAPCDCAVRH